MNDYRGGRRDEQPRADIPFRDIAQAVADLPLMPMLAIANRKLPLTKESSPAEVYEMLAVFRSYLTRWLIPALELRINPFAGSTHFRRTGGNGQLKDGVEDLMAAVSVIRSQMR